MANGKSLKSKDKGTAMKNGGSLFLYKNIWNYEIKLRFSQFIEFPLN